MIAFNVLAVVAALLTGFSVATSADAASPVKSDGLFTLATTGWADQYAGEEGGLAFDETGGKPGAFTYSVDVNLDPARAQLLDTVVDGQLVQEFLAPHFAISPSGDVTVMVAPHLLVDGEIVKGANSHKDNFVVIFNGNFAKRFDYSEDAK